MELTEDMQVGVKREPVTTLDPVDPLDPLDPLSPAQGDAAIFSALQSQLERMRERAKALRKRILPVRKRLQKRMEEQRIAEMRCGNFVLEMDVDSDSGEETGEAVFTRDRVREHFGEEQYEAYCESNQRPKRKKRKLSCRRDVVDIEADAEADAETEQAGTE